MVETLRSRPLIPEITIRPIDSNDRPLWEPLWLVYLDFYQKTVPQETTEITWKRLIAAEELRGLLALDHNGAAVGMAHYFFHPATSRPAGSCYIEDLLVLPAMRGRRVGRRLIAAVVELAKARKITMVYWQTEEFNGPARRLYERVAKRSPFIRYQIEL